MQAESWQLLASGSSEEFVDAASREVFAHPAVHHPYLRLISKGQVPDVAAALRDYARQYPVYAEFFTSYVEAVMASLDDERHQDILAENLREEQGDPRATDDTYLPHRDLFVRFQRAIGVDEAYKAEVGPCPTVQVWRDLFLQKCRSKHAGVGVGAMCEIAARSWSTSFNQRR